MEKKDIWSGRFNLVRIAQNEVSETVDLFVWREILKFLN